MSQHRTPRPVNTQEAAIDELQAEIVHLKAALNKYGRHTQKCLTEMAFSGKCICGFEEALKIK